MKRHQFLHLHAAVQRKIPSGDAQRHDPAPHIGGDVARPQKHKLDPVITVDDHQFPTVTHTLVTRFPKHH